MKYDIVTIGDASEDVFVKSKNLKRELNRKFVTGNSVTFELGEKIPIDEIEYHVGGSACNSAVSFSRQGFFVSTIVNFGVDFSGEKIKNVLLEENVDLSLINQNADENSNLSIIFLVGDERTIFVYHGISNYSDLAPKKSLHTRWIYLGPMGEGSEKVFSNSVSLSSEKGTKIIWNPGVRQIEKGASRFRPLLKNCEIISLNLEESIKFIHTPIRPDIKNILKLIHSFGPKIVLITRGKDGADAYDGEKFYHIDAMNRNRVDATGAGDSFTSAFVGQCIANSDDENLSEIISQALKAGIVNSSSVVNQIGAQKGLLSMSEIEDGISKNPRIYVEVK